ncbi:hypothetical protein Bhyg_01799 [Pseudolycoriella hygida]|uniref:Tudor domain-containing protein n=1 Tax=Pseudolycoriella hygida TaxID=35572 RepID=A0A9Q0NA57_9DIPT|nr:hypothetical protein Bhyg_01799 [Pseudolycoriella hygida]
MKQQKSESKGELITITHCISPHQFYFKYTNNVDPEFTKFDFEIQQYGNNLFHQKIYENGYLPSEKELVIFFHTIFNKWFRGEVMSIGPKITLWCVDNGISQTCSATQILPLVSKFHEDTHLVHLGGLSLLPTEKNINDQFEVETHLSRQWEEKTMKCFKEIVNTSKTFQFYEEFQLSDHKFGYLAMKGKDVNNILLQMNNVALCRDYCEEELLSNFKFSNSFLLSYFLLDLQFYVCKDRLEASLQESLINGSTIRNEKVNKSSQPLKSLHTQIKSESNVSSTDHLQEDFDDSVSRHSSIATMPDTDTKSSASSRVQSAQEDTEEHSNVSKPSLPLIQTNVNGSSHKNNLRSQCYDESDVSSSTNSANGNSSKERLSQTYECYLRSYRISPKITRKPKDSTISWWRQMNRSMSDNTPVEENDNLQAQTSLPAASSVNTNRHRNMLAKLSSNNTAACVNNVKNSNLFGVPAGYAKNCLNTFGGLTSKR